MNWVKEIIKSIFIIFVAYVVFIILDNSFSNFLKFKVIYIIWIILILIYLNIDKIKLGNNKKDDKEKLFLIDHQAQGEKYNSDNSKILDNFSESIGKDFVMYFEIFSIICVPVYL